MKLGAVLIFGAMAAAGWISGAGAPPSESSAADVSGPPATGSRPAKHKGPPDEVVAQLAAVRNARGEVERTRAAIALAKSIPVADIPRWLSRHWFNIRGGPEMMVFNIIMRNRWQQADPAGYSVWILKTDSSEADSALAEWAKQDRQGFLNFFRTTKDQNSSSALRKLAEDDPQLALAACCEALKNCAGYEGQNWISNVFPKIAEKNPALIEGILDQLPDQLKKQAESILSGQRLVTSFDSEIRRLWESPNGWETFQNSSMRSEKLSKDVLRVLADMPDSWKRRMGSGGMSIGYQNPQEWLKKDLSAAGFTPQEVERLKLSALGYMYRDPQGALDFINQNTLSEENHKQALMNFYGNVQSREDKDSLLAQLSAEDRKTLDDYAKANASSFARNPEDRTPEKWIEKISAIEDINQNYWNLGYETREWTSDQWQSFSSQFQDMPADIKKKMATALSGNSFSGRWDDASGAVRGEAIAYLVSNPDKPDPDQNNTGRNRYRQGDNTVQLASTYAVEFGTQDPVAAGDWVQKLPEGDAKLWAQKNLALSWNRYDSDAVDRWIQSLPASAREPVQSFVKSGGHSGP